MDAIDQFSAAMQERGLIPPSSLLADGRIHSCGTDGKPRGKDGRYLLHLNFPPSGGFQNHRDGQGWQRWTALISRRLTPEERRVLKQRVEEDREQRKTEQVKRYEIAAGKAAQIWSAAQSVMNHAYLKTKNISAHGIRVGSDGRLVIPVMDSGGQIQSLQFISPDGSKRFLPGGQVKGCFHLIGKLVEGVIGIAEGYATAATIHELTGDAVAVAFDCGNLKPVALALRQKHPDAALIIYADDDLTAGNPGLTRAREAAAAVGNGVALRFPDWDRLPSGRPQGATDFNDLMAALKATGGAHE